MRTLGWTLGLLAAFALICISDLVSEEARTRLDRLPHALIRLAARRAPAEIRDELGAEWAAELHEILRGAEARPITRLVIGLHYAASLLGVARRVGRQLAPDTRRASPKRAVTRVFDMLAHTAAAATGAVRAAAVIARAEPAPTARLFGATVAAVVAVISSSATFESPPQQPDAGVEPAVAEPSGQGVGRRHPGRVKDLLAEGVQIGGVQLGSVPDKRLAHAYPYAGSRCANARNEPSEKMRRGVPRAHDRLADRRAEQKPTGEMVRLFPSRDRAVEVRRAADAIDAQRCRGLRGVGSGDQPDHAPIPTERDPSWPNARQQQQRVGDQPSAEAIARERGQAIGKRRQKQGPAIAKRPATTTRLLTPPAFSAGHRGARPARAHPSAGPG
jgi:hypothetical protein